MGKFKKGDQVMLIKNYDELNDDRSVIGIVGIVYKIIESDGEDEIYASFDDNDNRAYEYTYSEDDLELMHRPKFKSFKRRKPKKTFKAGDKIETTFPKIDEIYSDTQKTILQSLSPVTLTIIKSIWDNESWTYYYKTDLDVSKYNESDAPSIYFYDFELL